MRKYRFDSWFQKVPVFHLGERMKEQSSVWWDYVVEIMDIIVERKSDHMTGPGTRQSPSKIHL